MKLFKAMQRQLLVLFTTMILFHSSAFASQMGVNAWEKTLRNIADSLTGPVAYAIAIMAIMAGGVTIAFADMQGGMKKLVQAALGLSIAFFAAQITTSFLGFSGAVL